MGPPSPREGAVWPRSMPGSVDAGERVFVGRPGMLLGNGFEDDLGPAVPAPFGRYERASLAALVGSATAFVEESETIGGARGGLGTYVSAGGGPTLVVGFGITDGRVGLAVREGALVSVVKGPPTPYCSGSI